MRPERSRAERLGVCGGSLDGGRFSALHGGLSELDAAIVQCRLALRRARHRGFKDREIGYSMMSSLLEARANLDVSRRATDLAEAEQLCRKVLAHGSEPAAAGASEQLAGILAARNPPAAPRREKRLGRAVSGPGEAYRDAFARQSRVSLGGSSRVAAAWAGWATSQGDAEEAAEAHRCWLTAVVDESKRRFLRVENERHLSKIQGLAAEAGMRYTQMLWMGLRAKAAYLPG